MKLYDMLFALLERSDKVDLRLGNIEKQLAVYNEQLMQHIEGVELARKQIEILKIESDKRLEILEKRHLEDVTARKFKKAVLNLSIKILTALSLLSGIIYGAIQYL